MVDNKKTTTKARPVIIGGARLTVRSLAVSDVLLKVSLAAKKKSRHSA